MVWSMLGTSSTASSSMAYSTVVNYFEHLQVTAFTLDRNTGVITLNIKEGDIPLPGTDAESTVESTGGLLSGMLAPNQTGSVVQQEEDGTVTVRYQLPYAAMFVENVTGYIEAYDEANPDAPMVYDYVALKETIPWMEILFYLAMLGCTGFILFSMLRGGGAGGNIMNVGRAKVKDESENQKTATFADVAGEDEEKEELQEVVEFLKSPNKFNSLGARIPHGVLLVGPPGTGKTLLARACAGEAGVPFYSISGSDFVEMYVGVGASRVRDLFDKAKKTMPCIVFIDEIDAVGRQRGAGLGGGHDEREQTLNQLLVEMDGFQANDGVIVIAATNRADILDKALLRPGRFDRQVYVGLPDVKGREEILKVHTRNKPLAPDVSLKVIAQRTPGFAGADLENLVNEAALLAARRNRKAITMEDIEEASMKVMAGPEKKSRVVTPEEKKLTAYHEAGHAVAGFYCKHHPRVHEITIIPRGQAGGYTMYLPEKDRSYVTKGEMFEDIVSSLGGRVAEQLILEDISTGASNDLQQATNIARQMITKYGFSERLGPVVYGTAQEETFLGRDLGMGKGYSETTAAEIDSEMRDIIDEAYETCRRTLTEHIDQLHALANALMEREKLNENEFNAIMKGETLPEQEEKEPEAPAAAPVEQAEPAETAEPAEQAEPAQPVQPSEAGEDRPGPAAE
ncbi:MAG: ATP-dependent zinc metalloprotease FtsH [Candidatus Faecalibacterium intestinavium]|uniref:ATP-dependent zinc metalloprotease FtsH n=1 Tax=Candidatus Faecalibacterium intestinavium TaxID=2838580 RepID=A0A9E2NPR9_9FIRM|nr:ATP-dependent zinc metalloprotease FtsH [Candidatus Faecalibacterium intestinavium]